MSGNIQFRGDDDGDYHSTELRINLRHRFGVAPAIGAIGIHEFDHEPTVSSDIPIP